MNINLKAEISLKRDFVSKEEEIFLAYIYTWQRAQKLGYKFFSSYQLSDAQFNVLMILYDLKETGVYQHELASRLLVNRATVGGLVGRLEKKGHVKRVQDATDRRANLVHITSRGEYLLLNIKKPYYALLAKTFDGFTKADLESFLHWLNKYRKTVNHLMANYKFPVKNSAPLRHNGSNRKTLMLKR